jgi:hypothetical protein
LEAADGGVGGGGVELDAVGVAGERAAGFSSEEEEAFAGGTEAEARRGSGRGVELVLVEDDKAAGSDGGAVGDAELGGDVGVIAEEPAADVDRGGGEVVELDGILEGRVRVGQELVDDDTGENGGGSSAPGEPWMAALARQLAGSAGVGRWDRR